MRTLDCVFEFVIVLLYFRFFSFKFFKKIGSPPDSPKYTAAFGDFTVYRELKDATTDTIGVRLMDWRASFFNATFIFFHIVMFGYNETIASVVAFFGLGSLFGPGTFRGATEFELSEQWKATLSEKLRYWLSQQIDFTLNRKIMLLYHTAIIWIILWVVAWVTGSSVRVHNLIPLAYCPDTHGKEPNGMVTDAIIVLMTLVMFMKTWVSGVNTLDSAAGFALGFAFHVLSRTLVGIGILSFLLAYSTIIGAQNTYQEIIMFAALLLHKR